MRFDKPLSEGILLKRYKRFFADIKKNKETLIAHCPNTGSMKGLLEPNMPCRFSNVDDPNRKLKHTLQMIKAPTSWVGVNTGLPNKLVRELWESKTVKAWKNFDCIQMETKISDKSRIDMVMWNSEDHPSVKKWQKGKLTAPMHLVEVKNVTMAEGKMAMFPDAVTERGQKHITELMDYIKRGFTCELVFVIQREDCTSFAPADDIDPKYGKLLREAKKKGLIITPLTCDMQLNSIELENKKLKLKL